MIKNKFRLPRKIKKRIKSNGLLLYPSDSKNNSLMAIAYKLENDYIAYKSGILRKFFDFKSVNNNKFNELDNEIYVDDIILKKYINDIFRKDIRISKTHYKAKKAYFNFILWSVKPIRLQPIMGCKRQT